MAQVAYGLVEFDDSTQRIYEKANYEDRFAKEIHDAFDRIIARNLRFGRDNQYANPKVERTKEVIGPLPVKFKYWIGEKRNTKPPVDLEWTEIKREDYESLMTKWD